ncbi:MAG: hypothetical protein AAF919_03950 [Pseudomonadota bacterium]
MSLFFQIIESRSAQAVIAGVFVAAGWLVNGRQNRRAEARLRAERLRDAHRAIFAEIDANLSNLFDATVLRADGAAMVERMQADEAFIPFIPRERHDRIFRALEAEIHVLPRVTIDPIVSYYAQLDSLNAHVEDMRGNAFRSLPQGRRIEMYEDYVEMKVATLMLGRRANWLIKVFSRDGKDVAEETARKFNIPSAADPSDQ